MNAEQLLQHFERISEAADAIPRLRGFILDLAVRGKLLEQEPSDEPAAELLKRIAVEKARLVKAGEIKKQKPLLAPSETPFPIPSNWRWSQLAEIGVLNPRNEAPDMLEASFVPMPLIAADYGVANQHEVRPWAEIKKGYTHFAEGDVGLAKITPCFENGKSTVFRNLTGGIGSGTTELYIVRPLIVDQDYILLFLKSPHFIETGIPKMTGTAGQKRVPSDYFANSPFPLPPLAEQHRIVAKVDELMSLCDQLEAAKAEREQCRDSLVAASLQGLNQPAEDEETFREHARFTFNNLPRITTRAAHIKQLRQTILNLAVRGKLVEQNPTDTPVSKLLNEIAERKARAVDQRSVKTSKKSVEQVEPWCSIPGSWHFVRLDKVANVVMGSSPPGSTYNKIGEGVPLINGPVEFTPGPFGRTLINQYTTAPTAFCNEGDFLVCVRGSTTGRTNVAAFRACVGRGVAAIQPLFEDQFVRLAIRVRQEAILQMGRGIAFPSISRDQLAGLPIPLPPLAEQYRIVAKVDQLMTICDQLEAQIKVTEQDNRRFLESVLADALAPGIDLSAEVQVA